MDGRFANCPSSTPPFHVDGCISHAQLLTMRGSARSTALSGTDYSSGIFANVTSCKRTGFSLGHPLFLTELGIYAKRALENPDDRLSLETVLPHLQHREERGWNC